MSSFTSFVTAGRMTLMCILEHGDMSNFSSVLREYLNDLGEIDNYPALMVSSKGMCSKTNKPRLEVSWCVPNQKDFDPKTMEFHLNAKGAMIDGTAHEHSHYERS